MDQINIGMRHYFLNVLKCYYWGKLKIL